MIMKTQNFLGSDGEPRLAYITRNIPEHFYEIIVVDKNCKELRNDRMYSDLDNANFIKSGSKTMLLFTLEIMGIIQLYCIKTTPPHEIERIARIPFWEMEQFKANDNWGFVFLTCRGKMALFCIDLTMHDQITRLNASCINKKKQLAITGYTRDDTLFYYVERTSGYYQLCWKAPYEPMDDLLSDVGNERWKTGTAFQQPFVTGNSDTSVSFEDVDVRNENIIYMNSFRSRVIVVSQDTLKRNSIATLKIFVFDHGDRTREPQIIKKVMLKDYHSPLNIELSTDGIIVLSHRNKCGLVDIKNTGTANAVDVAIVEGSDKSLFFAEGSTVYAWSSSATSRNMILRVYKNKMVTEYETDWEYVLSDIGVEIYPYINKVDDVFYGVLATSQMQYIKSYTLTKRIKNA